MTLSFVFCPCLNNNQIMTGRKALCPEFTFGTSKGPYLHEALGTVLQGSQAGETRFIPDKGGITFAITSKAAPPRATKLCPKQ